MTRLTHITFARPRVRDSRNTQDSYRCRECNGAGCTELQVGLCDFDVTYCRACDGEKWVKWRDVDPLVEMSRLRKWAGLHQNLFRKYQEVRQKALGSRDDE